MAIKGIIISGRIHEILVRVKSGENIEIGELLVYESGNSKKILQCVDLYYGSQVSQQNLELASGMRLEDADIEFLDKDLRHYKIAVLKDVISISDNKVQSSKDLPNFFSDVRSLQKEDLDFISLPDDPMYFGSIRSASSSFDIAVNLTGRKVISHHILIPATTGAGKSNLASVMLWNLLDKEYAGVLVLDPHDEYYGRNGFGLKDHLDSKNLVYYSINPPAGCRTLKMHIDLLKPSHFNGSIDLSPAQKDALSAYYKEFGKRWIEAIILEKPLNIQFHEATLSVVRRKILSILNLKVRNNQVFCEGIFDINSGESTIEDICDALENSKTVVIDTSSFGGSLEILIGSILASEIFSRYRFYKINGSIQRKPVVSIFLEEAPRVLGKEVLQKGQNIFSTIAREGRKFRIGLTAITQLPSMIPRDILANMNTKIILRIEMAQERQAIIDSSAQDLSTDSKMIASLNTGEAILTSNFAKFALPLKIPYFMDYSKKNYDKNKHDQSFSGVNIQ